MNQPSSVRRDSSGEVSSEDLSSRVVICRLNEGSVTDLVELDLECSFNFPPWSESLFRSEFNNENSFILGARLNGQLVGFVVIQKILDEAHVLSFGVSPGLRRLGIGRQLMIAAMQSLTDSAILRITLEVRESNVAARALYEALGFLEVGLRKEYYSNNRENAVLMTADLLGFNAGRL